MIWCILFRKRFAARLDGTASGWNDWNNRLLMAIRTTP
jgi:hypothetical protein